MTPPGAVTGPRRNAWGFTIRFAHAPRVFIFAPAVFAAVSPAATGAFARHGADDPAGHDAGDDRDFEGPNHG